MSFIKYQGLQTTDRGQLSFARAHLDGMPFRGQPSLLREDEIATASETVHDAKVGLYDLSIPEQAFAVQQVLDRIVNSWYKLLFIRDAWHAKADGTMTLMLAVAWSEPHKELNKSRLPTRGV